MSLHADVLPLEVRRVSSWSRYLVDSVLACGGSLLITGGIALWHLYPRIPNISIVYLLVIVGLASTRGRYPAILASVVAFLSFDFFLVPPFYTFVMYHVEEWTALFVFLVDAIITSQLAVALRQRAEQAARRERETHILYDLMRLTTREDGAEQQLHAIARAVVAVFSPWGIDACTLLQPDQTGTLRVQASTSPAETQSTLSADEQATATWAMMHGQMTSFSEGALSSQSGSVRLPGHYRHKEKEQISSEGAWQWMSLFIPLKVGQEVVGMLRLRVLETARQIFSRNLQQGRPEDSRERAGERTAFFWTFLDQVAALMERVRLRQENLRIELLQRTDSLRASLLSSVSHDLRTPLTSIKAAASSLLQEDVQWDDEARRSFAGSIEREADRLNRLVSNLLDLSRIEDGALKPEKEWYPLAPLIYEVLDRLQPLLQGRVVQTRLATEIPAVELDYLMMDQVLTNLIENAVRYTPPDSPIEVSIHWNGGEVLICVADRGPGIAPTDRERIFDRFYRVLSKELADYPSGGSGLGLAVCLGIIEAHQGRIWAEAREGGGAIFTVALPIGSPEGILVSDTPRLSPWACP